MTFDAHKTAETMEKLAHERIDTNQFDTIPVSVKLADEWLKLTPAQRLEVGKDLEKNYDNWDRNDFPRPHMEFNKKGECVAIDFSASYFDDKKQVSSFKVAALSPETGGTVVEVLHKEHGQLRLDGISVDTGKTQRDVTPAALEKAGGFGYDFRGVPSAPADVPPNSDQGTQPAARPNGGIPQKRG